MAEEAEAAAEEDEEDGASYEYLEDIYVEDIGLTWVTSKWDIPDALSPEDAERYLPREGGPAAYWLRLPETAVEEFDRSKARQLGQDIRRLLRSPLPDEVIRTVWLGATHGCSDPVEYAPDTRTWLRRLEEVWLARVRQDDPAFTPPPPQPVVDEEMSRAVLRAIRSVADDLSRATAASTYGRPPVSLVPALEQTVVHACADLGYRLFLRSMNAYFVAIDRKSYDSFDALGRRFGYPRFLVHHGLNYRE
ncbi:MULTISPECIES: hypothetical protein [Streptomyces]|uniref:hypothetical protein n=1 Tax=Streptomyces TaxID=1883 RepID=UPI00163B81FE|nr:MULTISPECIES: hypothetical protein [Streptomyces]MBC2878798.1 hypothetical protein [Streptomyces sp. TYQ1024]UBI39283.1 hypothetical protein K7I03_24365 [Streptomyces mobaraensis]UKW31864.1 hypothetical protein MCU78_24305 [Streptomyces sp. TYQ1024]